MRNSTRHPVSSLRFWSYTVTAAGELERQLRFIRENPKSFDDIWLGTLNGLPSLAEHDEYADACARAADRIRAAGLGVSLQITESLGHWGYGADSYAGFGNWRLMVDQRGVANENVACILDAGFLDYIQNVATVYAGKIRPDTLWIDDDWRLNNHGQMQFGCFCPVCLTRFSAEDGRNWTRESLVEALTSGADSVRGRWLAFNQKRLAEGAAKIASAIHAASPETRVALQNCHLGFCYNGLNFSPVYQALAENSGLLAGVRVGSGAYTDFNPVHILDKAYTLGGSAQEALASGWVDLAISEVENYPHSLLGKTPWSTAFEGALELAFGCNGLSFVLGPYQSKTDAEEGAYFRTIAEFRVLYDRLIALHAEARPTGLNPARAPGHVDHTPQTAFDWTDLDANEALNCMQSAIPVQWRPGEFGSPAALVTEELAQGCDQAAFDALCRHGALMSGNAFLALQQKGLTSALGIRAFKVDSRVNYWETAVEGAFNGDDAGTHYYIPAAFGASIAFAVESDVCTVEVLSRATPRKDATRSLGDTALLVKTPQGGTLALNGMPGAFTRELTGFKQRQLLRMADAVYPGGLPVMPEAGQAAGIIPWCRADGGLRAVVVFNPTISVQRAFSLELRGLPENAEIRCWRPGSNPAGELVVCRDGKIEVPALNAWHILLFEVMS